MANLSRKDQLKGRLTAQQQKAIYLLVENEMLPNAEQRTQEEIAQELGVERMTLYRWRTRNEEFIEFKNLVADDFLASDRDRVYGVLRKMIFGSQPSVKAIDLYMKRFGLLTEKIEQINTEGKGTSIEDLERQLDELK